MCTYVWVCVKYIDLLLRWVLFFIMLDLEAR